MKLTSLIRFLKMSKDSDDRIYISSLDQMTGPRLVRLCLPCNSPKSRNDEVMISNIMLIIGTDK